MKKYLGLAAAASALVFAYLLSANISLRSQEEGVKSQQVSPIDREYEERFNRLIERVAPAQDFEDEAQTKVVVDFKNPEMLTRMGVDIVDDVKRLAVQKKYRDNQQLLKQEVLRLVFARLCRSHIFFFKLAAAYLPAALLLLGYILSLFKKEWGVPLLRLVFRFYGLQLFLISLLIAVFHVGFELNLLMILPSELLVSMAVFLVLSGLLRKSAEERGFLFWRGVFAALAAPVLCALVVVGLPFFKVWFSDGLAPGIEMFLDTYFPKTV